MQNIRNAAGKLIHRADGKSYCIEIARKRVRALPRVPRRIGAGAEVRPPQAAAVGSSASMPRLAFGAVTNLCGAIEALTIEGDLPSSLAISLHEALRSSLLWTVSRSCLVSPP